MQINTRKISFLLQIQIIFCFITQSYQNQNKNRRRIRSNTCRSTIDCPNNAFCNYQITSIDNNDNTVRGLCECNHDYMIVSENHRWECLKVAKKLYDNCIYDEQCMIKLSNDAECKDNICLCKNKTHYVEKENACYKSVKIGEYCKFTNNCIGEETLCQSGICICPVETHSNNNNTLCLRDKLLNEECKTDDECIIDNTRCHNICRCHVSYIVSQNGKDCIKIAGQLNDECIETTQCTEHIINSFCNKTYGTNGSCVCKDGYHQSNNQCFVSVELNGFCENNENCHIQHDGVDCINGHCKCRDGYYDITGYCSNSLKHFIYNNNFLLFIIVNILFIL